MSFLFSNFANENQILLNAKNRYILSICFAQVNETQRLTQGNRGHIFFFADEDSKIQNSMTEKNYKYSPGLHFAAI